MADQRNCHPVKEAMTSFFISLNSGEGLATILGVQASAIALK
jgi:hypothetical protein